MNYSLIFFETEAESTRREGPEAPAYWGAWSAYIDHLVDEKALVPGAGAGLELPSTATTIRQGMTIQDGPAIDAKEQLSGFVIINVPSLDRALELAKKAPCGVVEVRPNMPSPE